MLRSLIARANLMQCVSIVRTKTKIVDENWKKMLYLVFDAPSVSGSYSKRFAFLQKNVKQGVSSYAAIVGIKKCKGNKK